MSAFGFRLIEDETLPEDSWIRSCFELAFELDRQNMNIYKVVWASAGYRLKDAWVIFFPDYNVACVEWSGYFDVLTAESAEDAVISMRDEPKEK